MWSKRGWAEHPAGERSASDAEGPRTPAHSEYADPYYKSGNMKQHQHQSPADSNKSAAPRSHRSLFQIALSILYLIPGVQSGMQSLSFFNAALLGILGALAALAASAGGLSVLLTLLARWYLPATVTHVSLPMYFDYAAGPAAAGAWIPLLRPSPLAAALTPPLHRVSAAAAGLNPIQIHGSLGPGSTLSFSSSSSGSSGVGGGLGSWGSEGGFLGLGFGPASRAASGLGKQGSRSGWWFRNRSRSSSKRRSSADDVVAAAAAGVEVGAGVRIPERDWLVPQWGRMGMRVVLELPGWPETDLVQVTSEVVSQQGIVLGRSTRTWVPKPKPLVFRMISAFMLGPWRALGLLDNTVRVQLPMFDSFQNPQPPPGGWSSLKHMLHPKSNTPQSNTPQSDSPADSDSGGGLSEGHVAGPRAMWLRVTMIGRSAERGPPRVYRAAAVLDMKLGLVDRIAAALRPSLPACILLLLGSTALALGSGTVAAALLLAAYALYSAGSNIAAAGHDDDVPAAADAERDHHEQQQQQQEEEEGHGDSEEDLGFKQRVTAARVRSSEKLSAATGYDVNLYPESGVSADGRPLSHVDSNLGHETGVLGAKKQAVDRAPASVNTAESSASSSYDNYEDATDLSGAVSSPGTPAAAAAGSAPQQQQGKGWTLPSAAAGGEIADEFNPQGSNYLTMSKRQQQQQQQQDDHAHSAVSAIAKMVESKQQQQQQRVRGSGDMEAEDELMHDAGVSGLTADADDEWQDQLLAESDPADDGSSSSTTELAAARKGLMGQQGEKMYEPDDIVASVAGGASQRAGYAYQA